MPECLRTPLELATPGGVSPSAIPSSPRDLAPEVQPIYSGYYIWRGAPNEPDLSPDTRMTQLGVGIETNADRRSSKLLQTPTGIGFST